MSTWGTIHDGISMVDVSTIATANEAKWFAIQTRARHEKKVDEQLREKGITAFLPLSDELHNWSDRQKLVHRPLFSGYLFVQIADSPEARRPVLATTGVCWFVGNRGMGLPIPEKQIQDVHTILTSRVTYSPFPFMRTGQRVRIRGGCLDGVEGILLAKESDRRVVVSVELVRRSVAVQIDGYDLEEA
jgi:transcription antitermination factor NusG